jgi:D-alanyl-lipoteichoic acid acyltransferase DltB (MBOAT superfamily)
MLNAAVIPQATEGSPMLFNTVPFFFFFLLVFSLYCCLGHKWQNRMLLVASFVFYGWWDYRFVVLMIASASVDYVAALRVHAATAPAIRKRWLLGSVLTNLVILGFFKYYNFFVSSATDLLGRFGFHADPWTLSIILPLGISFYTFQAISYIVDVYRRELEPVRSYRDYLLFVAFFPHLVAGPIQLAKILTAQVVKPRHMTWQGWSEGSLLFLIGMFKKVVVADNLAPMVDLSFSNPSANSALTLLIGLYAFAFQIYADFSGYSDMARGLAKFMGFELMVNFEQPYFSSSITEFWRRWHISLSTWLRDYLYIPLGGNRLGTWNTYRNLFLTMLIGGFWHGASWNFVIWGGLHGVYLSVDKFLKRFARNREQAAEGPAVAIPAPLRNAA